MNYVRPTIGIILCLNITIDVVTMLELFGGLQELKIYFDDFLMREETRKQLEERLRIFLTAADKSI